MRNHGWHLPYHPLQIVAVAVFSALVFSFYVFFVPFVGSNVLRLHVIAGFSPLVFAVFSLYVRCAAIDPADSGIRVATQRTAAIRNLESSAEILLEESGTNQVTVDQAGINFSRSMRLAKAPDRGRWELPGNHFAVLCFPLIILSGCLPWSSFLQRKTQQEQSTPEEELLYCSLCEAEILKSSKHCRACDKCVDGFDHHCRWINNCIGKKNYKTFVAVMLSSLLMLTMDWSIGIFVLIRCFSNKHEFDKEIFQKLGSSFTRTPFVVVVTLCTFLAMLATLPLAQLVFFHIILMKKGITTYDYIVAIRDQETQDPPIEGNGGGSPSSSPASSTVTALSGRSPSDGLRRAVWCTPPRMFVGNQSNMKAGVVMQYSTPLWGASLTTGGGGTGGTSSRRLKEGLGTHSNRQIGLSPWKLARLSIKDAARAGIRARESSSILRPAKGGNSSDLNETEGSSVEMSSEVSTARVGLPLGWRQEVPLSEDLRREHERRNPSHHAAPTIDVCSESIGQQFDEETGRAIIPLGSEARSPFRSRWLHPVPPYPFSVSDTESPDNLGSPDLACPDVQHRNINNRERYWLYRATSDGYEASGGESADDASEQGSRLSRAWRKLKLDQSFISQSNAQNATIKWNSGLEGAQFPECQPDSRASSACEITPNGSAAEAKFLRHLKKEWPGVHDKTSSSTDGSNNSSPSYFVSPFADGVLSSSPP